MPLGCCNPRPFPALPTTARRFLYARFCKGDAWVVPYHPAILSAWGAHVNLQRVTNTSWSWYVLKYAAKMMLPTKLNLDTDALEALGLKGLSPQHAQLAAATVLAKPVCPCEAAHVMAGRPIIANSCSVTYLPTYPPAWKQVHIRYSNGTPYAVGSTTMLQLYLQRPEEPEFDSLTLVQYFRRYEVRAPTTGMHLMCLGHMMNCNLTRARPPTHKLWCGDYTCNPICARRRPGPPAVQVRRKGEKFHPEGRDPSSPAVADGAGSMVYKLAKERIVRRPISSPSNPNQSCWFNALLAHVATRSESDLVPHHGDYFNQCVLMGVFTTMEELDELIHSYAKYNLWDECRLNDLRRSINSHAMAAVEPLGAANDGAAAADYGPDVLLAGIEAMQELADMDARDADGDAPGADAAADAAAADGTQPDRFDPIRRLYELMQQDPAAVARFAVPASTIQDLTNKAEAACMPHLVTPLAVTYDMLSNDQRAAIDAVMQTVQQAQQQISLKAGTPSSEPLIACLQGGPGTGKSAVTRVLVDRAVEAGFKVLVTATSATAAQRSAWASLPQTPSMPCATSAAPAGTTTAWFRR